METEEVIVDTVNCPNGHKLEVIDSRVKHVGWLKTVWRRKRCVICDYRIKVVEMPIDVAKDVLSDD